MDPLLAVILFIGAWAVLSVAYLWFVRQQDRRDRLSERLAGDLTGVPRTETARPERVHPILKRYRWAPWVAGAIAAVLFYFLAAPYLLFAIVIGVIVELLGAQAEQMWYERRQITIERQLADSIDLIVSSLNAGSSAPRAIDYAVGEVGNPMGELLEDVLSRIQLGDDPQDVFRTLVRRVPLENFRLFATALSVHWEVGGSLGPTLAAVGVAVRDRIDLKRRIRSMTAQSRVSTMVVLFFTYFVAYVMWRWDPAAFELLIRNPTGRTIVASVLLLQAIGIAWMNALSKPRF